MFQNLERRYTNRPPFFDGTQYNYWTAMTMIYVQSVNYNIWKIIEYGPYMPTKTIKIDGRPDQTIPKSREEYGDEDKRKF